MRIPERTFVWVTLVCPLIATAMAFGAGTLTQIGALAPAAADSGVAMSRIYAISPDGTWAVGASNGQNLAGTITISQAIIWSAGSGLVQIPNPNDQANHAHGVVVNSSGNIIVAGYDFDGVALAYRMASYLAPTSNLTSGAWTLHTQHNFVVGEYNAERTYTTLSLATLTKIAGRRGNGNRAIASDVESSGTSFQDYRSTSNVPPGSVIVANTVSGLPRSAGSDTPVAAGYDNGNVGTLKRALFMPGPNGTTQTIIPGGSAYQSEAYGMIPTATVAAATLVGYDQDNTAAHLPHAFFWSVGELAMTLLPELPGDNQSAGIDVRLIGGNRLIGGYSSDGTTEHAVLWDRTGRWDSTGQPKLLSSLLAARGVSVSAWSSLSRVTTMSDDGLTVGGWGIWAADGTIRGFVATIPFCTAPAADFDHDCDVDADDYLAFITCASRTDVPVTAECVIKDLDTDGDADMNDFGIFQRCYSGTGIPANPNCAN